MYEICKKVNNLENNLYWDNDDDSNISLNSDLSFDNQSENK